MNTKTPPRVILLPSLHLRSDNYKFLLHLKINNDILYWKWEILFKLYNWIFNTYILYICFKRKSFQITTYISSKYSVLWFETKFHNYLFIYIRKFPTKLKSTIAGSINFLSVISPCNTLFPERNAQASRQRYRNNVQSYNSIFTSVHSSMLQAIRRVKYTHQRILKYS